MKNILWILVVGILTGACTSGSQSEVASTDEKEPKQEEKVARIISLNGTITELVYELGLEKELVGVDRTSTYPEAATKMTNLGHVSQLNAEAILALKPTTILVDEKNKDNEVLQTIANAGVALHIKVAQSHLLVFLNLRSPLVPHLHLCYYRCC